MRQPDGSTCLPTSLCMAMHFMGRCDLTSDTIFQMHKVCRTDRYNVPDLVRKYDLYAFPSWLEYAWTRETVEQELRNGRPVVMGLDCSRAGHFVLAVGYTDDGMIIIHDPANPHPGWSFNGAYTTTTWDKLIWRNGIMLRGEPFPVPPRSVSGTLVGTTVPKTLVRGEKFIAEFVIKNNGSVPWPAGVRLAAVDAYSTTTRERNSDFAILPGDADATSGTWISASVAAAPDIEGLPPGMTARFRVPLRAPVNAPDDRPVLYRENFNLIDAEGHWFSEHWQSGPSNRQITFRCSVVAPAPANFSLPLVETVEGGKPSLAWKLKNGGADVLSVASGAIAALPTSLQQLAANVETSRRTRGSEEGPPGSSNDSVTTTPEGGESAETTVSRSVALPAADSKVLKLLPAEGQDYEMAFVGDPLGTDYSVEAWVYCDVRPVPRGQAYERAGIFLHDSGQHRIKNKSELENGECLLMAYESKDGSIRAGNFLNGDISDSMRGTVKIKESGWHHFAIRSKGSEVTYELDGKQIASSRSSSSRGSGSRGSWRGRRGSDSDSISTTSITSNTGTSVGGESPRPVDPRGQLRYGDCGVFSRCLSINGTPCTKNGLLFTGFKVDKVN